jgi:hypothetical protein
MVSEEGTASPPRRPGVVTRARKSSDSRAGNDLFGSTPLSIPTTSPDSLMKSLYQTGIGFWDCIWLEESFRKSSLARAVSRS